MSAHSVDGFVYSCGSLYAVSSQHVSYRTFLRFACFCQLTACGGSYVCTFHATLRVGRRSAGYAAGVYGVHTKSHPAADGYAFGVRVAVSPPPIEADLRHVPTALRCCFRSFIPFCELFNNRAFVYVLVNKMLIFSGVKLLSSNCTI